MVVVTYGNSKPGHFFAEALSHMNLSVQFQGVQANRNSLAVKVLKKHAKAIDLDISKLKGEFQEVVGPLVKIRVGSVTGAPRDSSRKYGQIISNTNH